MAKLYFDWTPAADHVRLRLVKKPMIGGAKVIPYPDWPAHLSPGQLAAAAPVAAALADSDLDDSRLAWRDGDDVCVSHPVIARLTEAQAAALDGPPATNLHLDLRSDGILTDPNFRIRASWVDQGGTPVHPVRQGAILRRGSRLARIPSPLFDAVEAIDAFNAAPAGDDPAGGRFGALADLEAALPEGAAEQLQRDGYLESIRVAHAAAFSLQLPVRGGTFDFDPVLFGREVSEAGGDGRGGGLVDDMQALMPPKLTETFQSRFRQFDEARPCYALGENRYCYIDPSLRPVLAEVHRVQQADPATRRAFAVNPRRHLTEALGEDAAPLVERLFVETEEYSARVLGFAPWQPTVLPWVKRDPETWLPEDFGNGNSGLQIDGKLIPVPPEDVAPLQEAIRAAQAKGEDRVVYQGHEIPASAATLDALEEIQAIAKPRSREDKPGPEDKAQLEKVFVVVEENFTETRFSPQGLKEPRISRDWIDPTCLKSVFKPHQAAGVRWLWRGWREGLPGVLLADDMGLGKTLQVIAFLAALRELEQGQPKGPVLIVAPTGLLGNWLEEFGKHTREPFGRDPARLFGDGLKAFRKAETRGSDIAAGASLLDTEKLSGHEMVLTTYETLRDYHLSLAPIGFSVAVYDEMQKVKNPSSQVARAAKAVNADFSIGMTGTPVENALHDLWALFDILWPGHLGDSRSFVADFPETDAEKLKSLYGELTGPGDGRPAVMLRRMKVDHLEGLPEKMPHRLETTMPVEQGVAYRQVVETARRGEAGAMLETLHRLRGVSLHPVKPQEADASEDYVGQSARLAATFERLDAIKAEGEKALIFVEDLEMQAVVATLVQARYGLDHLPLRIHGGVAGQKRQKVVNDFQNGGRGFDVMILSPKAGGVGLTLTAANHVIHLSRWWNPAVEDQCTDRIYRIGQERTAHVYLPLAVHPDTDLKDYSFDLKLDALLERKRTMSRDFLAPPEGKGDAEALLADVLGLKPEAAGGGVDDGASTARLLADIDAMEPGQFEQWVIDRAKAAGLKAKPTPRTWDGGADVVIRRHDGGQVLCQCKHTQADHPLNDDVVADLLKAKSAYAVDGTTSLLVAITNADRLAQRTETLAGENGIVLIGRDGLARWPGQLGGR